MFLSFITFENFYHLSITNVKNTSKEKKVIFHNKSLLLILKLPSAISTLRGEGEKYRFQISTLKGLAKLLKKKYSQQLSILFHVKMSKKLAKRNNEEIK